MSLSFPAWGVGGGGRSLVGADGAGHGRGTNGVWPPHGARTQAQAASRGCRAIAPREHRFDHHHNALSRGPDSRETAGRNPRCSRVSEFGHGVCVDDAVVAVVVAAVTVAVVVVVLHRDSPSFMGRKRTSTGAHSTAVIRPRRQRAVRWVDTTLGAPGSITSAYGALVLEGESGVGVDDGEW